ncbi:MAG TPA: fumarylacetoacetate hydrolase family protein, partial [Polymorphobacter sp.]|nr:fumarylacetoacetate hydrolase family protein [Polymorphobacter sp.]
LEVNGQRVQNGNTRNFIFGVPTVLAYISQFMTLEPGDIVLTGTPANSRPMQPGDVVEVEVTGLGRLTNRVADIPAPAHDVGHQPTDTDAVRRVALGGEWWKEQDALKRP